jgi:KDO2-lipid IV(A) lauroyltransferase
LKFAGFCGELWFLFNDRNRKIAESQMEFALGISGKKLKAHVRACFESMAKNLIDIIRMGQWSKEYIGDIVNIEGLEHFDSAYNQGKGVIALTGHIGNFELLAAWFSYYKGYKVSVIGRKLYDIRFDRMLVSQRQRFNINNIPTTSSVKTIMKVLNDGHLLGVLLDQDSTKVTGCFVDFFGKKANTAAGPIYIARKTGSPVLPMAIYRKNDDKYSIRIMPPLELNWTNNKDENIKKTLVKCNRAIEELIRYNPTQWVWIHNRWQTRPPEEKAISK